MLIIQIAGGLGNQMQQYAVYTKLREMGKDVKLDLSWFDPQVQKNMLAPREFELPIFGGTDYEECSAFERDALLKQGLQVRCSKSWVLETRPIQRSFPKKRCTIRKCSSWRIST